MLVGVHTALWVRRWGEDLAPHLERAATLGFDGVEVSLLGLDEPGAQRVARVAADVGLAVRCTTGLGADHDPSSPEVAVRRAALDHLHAAADLTATAGADLLTGVTYGAWGSAVADDRAGRTARSAEVLAEVAPAFAERGLGLGVEAVNRFESDLVTTAAEAVAFVEAVDHPAVGVHLDTFHMHIEERSLVVAFELAGDRLVHVHVVDNDRGAPGRGQVRWDQVAAGLAAIGYDGWVGLELFVTADVPVSADLRIWRTIEADPTEAAAAGLAFVRERLA